MKVKKQYSLMWLLVMIISMGFYTGLSASTLPQTKAKNVPVPKGLWKAFSEARHAVEVNKDTKEGYAYKAYNPKNRYGIRYGEKGLKLQSGSWEFAMELQAYGQEKNLKPVEKAKLSTQGNKVTFDRGNVSEWYINGSKGLEQGFTLKQPKEYDKTKELILSLSLQGDLNPKWKTKGKSLTFSNGKNKAFDYEKLKAFDANGKTLPARLALNDKTLEIRVNTKDAAWPVTVDPIFATEQKVVGVTSDAAASDYFGRSVALDGDTVVIGAPYDDDNGSGSGSAYIMAKTAAGWFTQAKLTASDATAADYFGISVALDGDTVLVGANGDDDGGTGSGSAYVFVRSDTIWIQQAKLTASDAAVDDYFGRSVALDGDTAVVGAYNDDDGGTNSGSAYVFVRTDTVWNQQTKLTASDAAPGDFFGWSLALNGDTALVGAYLDNGISTDSGSAYVFVRSGATWSQQAKLTASDAEWDDRFGNSVALHGDTALVGMPYDDDGGKESGSAYVFVRSGATWSQQTKFTASDAAENDRFGVSVALNGDIAVVGAYYDDDDGENSGSAYVFIRSSIIWKQQAKLTASDAGAGDYFGFCIAFDGDTVLVGAPYNDDGGTSSGSAYVFTLSGAIWSQQAKLIASDAEDGQFGWSVALDGDTAVVAEPYSYFTSEEDFNNKSEKIGSVYVFIRSGTTWSQQAKLIASEASPLNGFGWSVALDGDTVLVGAPLNDDGVGSAYVFVRSGATWSQQVKLTSPVAAVNDQFGRSVALDGDTALVGAIYEDIGGAVDSGSVYVFVRSGATWSQQTRLIASDASEGLKFGSSIALDGATAAIGTTSTLGLDESAYIFVHTNNMWIQQTKLTAWDGSPNFGSPVALDGNTIMVGASSSSGRFVFIFTRSGTVWTQQAKLAAPDIYSSGSSIALDGDTALVGAPADLPGSTNSGSAYVFTRSGTIWSQQGKLTAPNTVVVDWFAYSVAFDGDTALVGAPMDDDVITDSGSAYFNRFECGFTGPIVADRWTMIGLPCDTGTTDTVEEIFGDTLDPNDYYYRWVVYERNEATGYYERLDLGDTMTHGRGYWIKSMDQSYWDVSGTLTQYPVITGCADPEGCFEYTLETPASTGESQYNLLGFPANTKRVWASVRFMIDGTSYTPTRAEDEGLVSKSIWTWNGNSYDTYDDSTPGMQGDLNSHEGFWVKVLDGSIGSIVKILIPANSVIGTPPPPPGM